MEQSNKNAIEFVIVFENYKNGGSDADGKSF